MLIILPDEGQFEAVEERLSADMIQDLSGSLSLWAGDPEPAQVHLHSRPSA